MCLHNNRLDESLCWKCCSGKSSEIDWDAMVSIVSAPEIESQWQADFLQIFPVNYDLLPLRSESDKKFFKEHWRGDKYTTFEQFLGKQLNGN